jgi:hypothetical protein
MTSNSLSEMRYSAISNVQHPHPLRGTSLRCTSPAGPGRRGCEGCSSAERSIVVCVIVCFGLGEVESHQSLRKVGVLGSRARLATFPQPQSPALEAPALPLPGFRFLPCSRLIKVRDAPRVRHPDLPVRAGTGAKIAKVRAGLIPGE